MATGMLAHGGTAGAAFEAAFLLVPIALFALLSSAAKRRRDAEDAEDTGNTETAGDAETAGDVP